MNFGIFCSSSVKSATGICIGTAMNLHRDCNELIDCFVCYGHFNNIVVV